MDNNQIEVLDYEINEHEEFVKFLKIKFCNFFFF